MQSLSTTWLKSAAETHLTHRKWEYLVSILVSDNLLLWSYILPLTFKTFGTSSVGKQHVLCCSLINFHLLFRDCRNICLIIATCLDLKPTFSTQWLAIALFVCTASIAWETCSLWQSWEHNCSASLMWLDSWGLVICTWLQHCIIRYTTMNEMEHTNYQTAY